LLKEAKLRCDFEADEPSIEKIVAALVTFFEKSKAASTGAPSR